MSATGEATARSLDPIEVVESDTEDLAIQRYLLDLALQPIDRFDGFSRRDQFVGGAYRFQLNFLCYALTMAQYTRTPAFTGYLHEAQANAIEKMRDRRIWRYWATENLVGYGRWNPDPIGIGNVMYTGFLGAMLAMYETMNDDRRFSEPGAFTLTWNKRTRYTYDFPSIARAIERNMRDSKHTQYPCEPHLIYPMCNAFAINTLPAFDRLHGADLTGDLVGLLRESYDRFGYLRPDGRFIGGRSERLVSFPPLIANDAVMAYWLHPVLPELAEQTWRMLRGRFIVLDSRGGVELKTTRLDRIDLGNYASGDGQTRAALMCVAKEMGDTVYAEALERSLDTGFGIIRSFEGARRYARLSVFTNGIHALARFTRHDGIRDLLGGVIPPQWRTGPILTRAAYPDVLVARAVTDGSRLDLVLRPGNGTVDSTLEFARLTPGQSYRISGTRVPDLIATRDGTARVRVRLSDRTELSVIPAGQLSPGMRP